MSDFAHNPRKCWRLPNGHQKGPEVFGGRSGLLGDARRPVLPLPALLSLLQKGKWDHPPLRPPGLVRNSLVVSPHTATQGARRTGKQSGKGRTAAGSVLRSRSRDEAKGCRRLPVPLPDSSTPELGSARGSLQGVKVEASRGWRGRATEDAVLAAQPTRRAQGPSGRRASRPPPSAAAAAGAERAARSAGRAGAGAATPGRAAPAPLLGRGAPSLPLGGAAQGAAPPAGQGRGPARTAPVSGGSRAGVCGGGLGGGDRPGRGERGGGGRRGSGAGRPRESWRWGRGCLRCAGGGERAGRLHSPPPPDPKLSPSGEPPRRPPQCERASWEPRTDS